MSWWMHKESVRAKVTTDKDGSYIMWMEGEKYPFPGYPRGHLLYGTLSKLKHEIKNQIFNASWAKLEKKEPLDLTEALKNIEELAKNGRFDMMPYHKMCPVMRELYQRIENPKWRDIITYILQEDDGYRFRFQWLMRYINPKNPVVSFDKGMELLEHAEIIGDMKERVRLVRRVMLELLKDPVVLRIWTEIAKGAKHMTLSEADKYYFRAKYFKVDYPEVEY